MGVSKVAFVDSQEAHLLVLREDNWKRRRMPKTCRHIILFGNINSLFIDLKFNVNISCKASVVQQSKQTG